ncbi:ATP-binding protein [uncultured Duncaniella sp.]|uniref:ATP-binding protein n=1 Tax=uncultured Duncaniella sp. TaxID=2768039 RepID=UPI00261348EF|nr:ATP-binding protein [uncultured Duncaniella sp.]
MFKPRNPKMAQVFYRAGFIEAWGRGYEKIMSAFDDANLKRPEFIVEQGGVTAIIPREIFMMVRDTQRPSINQPETDQSELKPSQNRVKTELKLHLMEILRNDPTLSYVQIGKMLGMHRSSVQRRLDALVKEGKLRHVGPSNGGSWVVIE